MMMLNRLTYAEQLGLFSVEAMRAIANELGSPTKSSRREELAGLLSQRLGTPAQAAHLEKTLSPEDWEFLNLLRLQMGASLLRSLVAVLLFRGRDGAQTLAELSRFMKLGCFLPAALLPNNARMPVDLTKLGYADRNPLIMVTPQVAVWALERANRQPVPPVEPPRGLRNAGLLDLQRALFLVLSEAERKPIKITNAGIPQKPEVTRLAKAFREATGGKQAGGGKTPAPDSATMSFIWFVLGVAVDHELLQADGPTLVPVGADAVFGIPIEQLAIELFPSWGQGCTNDFAAIPTLTATYGHTFDPWLRSYDEIYGATTVTFSQELLEATRVFVNTALCWVVSQAPDAWYPIDDFAAFVLQQNAELLFTRIDEYQYYALFSPYGHYQPNTRRVYPDGLARITPGGKPTPGAQLFLDTDALAVEGALVRQLVVGPLHWLGLTETDAPSSGGPPTCFRLTDVGRHLLLGAPLETTAPADVAGRVIIQPNFEIVVTDAASNWRLLAQLDVFAERRQLDRAATYQLTQTALVQGMERGWTGDRILEVLERATGSPLPQNVAYSLREWVMRYESLTVYERATILEADAPEQLDQWLTYDAFRPLIRRRLGPTTVLIMAGRAGEVAEILKHRKRAPRVVSYESPPTNVLRITDPDTITLLTPESDPYLEHRLNALADPEVKGGGSRRYTINQPSITRAIESGATRADLLGFLGTASQTPLPPDFHARLLGWSKAIPPLHAEPLMAVELHDAPVTWAELQSIPAIGGLLRAVPLPTLAFVAPSDYDQLRTALEERGMQLAEHPITVTPPKRDRLVVLNEALGAFENPRPILRAMVQAGLIAHEHYY